MGSTIPKIAANCVIAKVQLAIGVAAGAHQFAVNAKGGCDQIHWPLQIIMEAEPDLDCASLPGCEQCLRGPGTSLHTVSS